MKVWRPGTTSRRDSQSRSCHRRPHAPRPTVRPLSQGRAWGGSAQSPPPGAWDGAAPELQHLHPGAADSRGREAGTGRGQGRSITTCSAEQWGGPRGPAQETGSPVSRAQTREGGNAPRPQGATPLPTCHRVNSAPPGEEELPAWPIVQRQSIFIMMLTVPDQGMSP